MYFIKRERDIDRTFVGVFIYGSTVCNLFIGGSVCSECRCIQNVVSTKCVGTIGLPAAFQHFHLRYSGGMNIHTGV